MTDTNVQNLIINKLTQAQYDGIANPSDTELYLIPDNGSTGEVSIDDITITQNTNDELQAVGVIDNNSGGALKTWTGTKAQYDAIATKDSNTLYNITDDSNVSIPLLELLFPVGSIYIGTMSTCPLQTLGIGTWQIVARDRVLQGAGVRGNVGTTVNESVPNVKGEIGIASFIKNASDSDINNFSHTGVFTNSFGQFINADATAQSTSWFVRGRLFFSASDSNSTYQDGAPVQQNAYLVNIWERIS